MKQKIIALSVLILGLQCSASSEADNSKLNVRDRSSLELTADQQS